MIRWILLDREIDDTAMAWGRERKEKGGAEAARTRRGTGGNKSSGKKKRESSKNKKWEENPQCDKRGAWFIISFPYLDPSIFARRRPLSSRIFNISNRICGTLSSLIASHRRGRGGGATSKGQQCWAGAPFKKMIRPEKHPSACLNTMTLLNTRKNNQTYSRVVNLDFGPPAALSN